MTKNYVRLIVFIITGLALVSFAAPQSLENRAVMGKESGQQITFQHHDADAVFLRHSGDDWTVSHALKRSGDDPTLWTISIADLDWKPGGYEFKFLVNGSLLWEDGPNRYAYVDAEKNLARPPARYLTWHRDPATTMTIHWHSDDAGDPSVVFYKTREATQWSQATGSSTPFPDTDRFIHTTELTELTPDTIYDFRIAEQDNTDSFRTMPATLERPVRFIEGGDVYVINRVADQMNRFVGSRDPDFAVMGGDLAYEDGRPELAWRWFGFFESMYHHLRAPDGRMIPIVVAIGNHEVKQYYVHRYDDYEPGPAWQLREAPYFFRLFAMPGLPGHQVLDFGDYASLILLDSGHTLPVTGGQTAWLKQRLDERKNVPHLFPVYHVPAYPSVRNPADEINTQIREHWVPLFEEAGMTLAFEHHDHAFKVTHPIKAGVVDPQGIVFIGDGAWGVDLREPHSPENTWYLRKSDSIHHVWEIELTADQRTVQAWDVNGNLLDRFTQIIPSITVDERH